MKLAVGVIVVATKEGQNRFVGTNRMLLVFGALVLRIPIEYHKAGDSEFAVEAIEAVELILAAATHYRDAFAIVVVFDLVERVRQDQRLALTLNEHDLRSEEALCSFLRVARVLERVTILEHEMFFVGLYPETHLQVIHKTLWSRRPDVRPPLRAFPNQK